MTHNQLQSIIHFALFMMLGMTILSSQPTVYAMTDDRKMVKQWSERAVRRYAESQEKMWSNWLKQMS